jgi:uncharacterized membrane protein
MFMLVLISAFLHATWNAATKKVSGDISTMWLGLVAASIAAFPFSSVVASTMRFTGFDVFLVMTSGVSLAIYFFLVGQAYSSGDISLVYPIARGINVAGAAVAGFLAFGEKPTTQGIIGILCVLGGTLIIGTARKTNLNVRRSFIFAIVTGLVLALATPIDKVAMGRMDPPVYIFYMFAIPAVGLAPWILKYRQSECLAAFRNRKKFGLAVGLGSLMSYGLILFVFRVGGPISYVVALREFSIALGAIYGFLFFDESVTRGKVVGIVLILAGILAIRL